MATENKLVGSVVGKFTGKRYPNTTVRLEPITSGGETPAAIAHEYSNPDGHFEITVSDNKAWPPGHYSVTAFHPDARQDPSLSVTLDKDKGFIPNNITLEIIPNEEISQQAGLVFLLVLILTLCALVIVYHQKHMDDSSLQLQERTPLLALQGLGENQLQLWIDLVGSEQQTAGGQQSEAPAANASPPSSQEADKSPQEQGAAGDNPETGSAGSNPEPDTTATDPEPDDALALATKSLNQTLAAIEKLLTQDAAMTSANNLDKTEVNTLKLMLESLKNAVVNKDAQSAKFAFDEFKSNAVAASQEYFWTRNPWRHLEILCWALAATLIRLILNAGNFLRLHCFHKQAIWQHVSLIFTIPILAIIIAFVISLVNIEMKLGDVGINFDMSNVRISIIVAALIGLAPWKAREFLGNLADRLFTKLGGLLKTQP